MTDTPAESAEDPRTPRSPEDLAEHVLWEVRNDPDVDEHPEATARECIIRGIRAALAALNAEWREAFTRSGLVDVLEDDPEPNEDTNPLRALLSEGKPGQ